MNDSIHKRLLAIEDEFLAAASQRGTTMEAFCGTWSALRADIDSAKQIGIFSADTAALAHSVSSSVKVLSGTLYDLDIQTGQLSLSLQAELDTIFAEEGMTPDRFETNRNRSPSPDKQHPCPPYIASAYKWLLHNIYKPYPTVEEIGSICVYSDTSEKRIRNWFISARRRMGWAKIAKEHFHSDREDTADAAYRALIEPDPKRPIEAKLMFEFVKMEVAAEGMYSSAFKPSQFAGSLGATVVGMSVEHKSRIEEMRQQAIEEVNIRKAVEHQMKRQRIMKRNGSQQKLVSLYPSPERSSCSSPEPTLVLSEIDEDETAISLPGAVAGHKRCRSSSADTLDSRVDKSATAAPFPRDLQTSLPSPSASAENDLLEYWASSDVSSIDPKLPTPSHTGRKRRLSDADARSPQKRPRGLDAGPRLYAVSDPLPMSNVAVQASELQNIPNFEFNFELPNTVTSQPWDPSVSIDVEFFNWTNDHTFSSDFFSSNTSSLSSIAQVDMPASELFSSTDPAFDMSGSAGATFDQFLHDMLSQPTESQVSHASTISQSLSPVPQPPTESASAVSSDWSAYVNSVPPSQDPVIVGSSSQPYGFIDLSVMPNFDPSMLKPPSPLSLADIIAQSEAAAKQSKLERCYAHLEAAMKLQQEITTGDHS